MTPYVGRAEAWRGAEATQGLAPDVWAGSCL
jgi:hypothetical protein